MGVLNHWYYFLHITKVLVVDENTEEEVTVSINNVEFVAFIAYAPYVIEIGKEYLTKISLFVDDIRLFENSSENRQLIREGDSFNYFVRGYLNKNGQLDVGFMIEDDLFQDSQYLYGKFVCLKLIE